LNERTTQVLDYIRSCDHSPSVREIGKALGISSPSAVQYHLRKLLESGEITRKNGRIVVRP